MIWIKKHGKVLAACDENIMGKKFTEGELELHVKENFYKGKLVSENTFSKLLDEMENINLVGEKTIRIAKRKSLVADVKNIDGVPFTIIFRLGD